MKLSFLILILTCGCLPAAENFIPPPFYNGIAPPPLPTEPPATVHGKGKLGVITTQESATEPKKDERAVTPVVKGTRESLLGTRSLGIPLISVPGPARREGDLTELAEAVNAQAVDTVSTELRRLEPLKKWLSLNPNTEFSPSVALRIGQVSSQNGDFLGASIHFEALRSQFDSSVNLSRAETQLLQKVLQEELSLYRRMGWKSQLEETLKVAEAQKNKTHLSYLISEARSALDLWQKKPLESMQCGLVAHNIVAAKIGLKVINRYDSLPEGDGQAAAWGIDVDGERNKEITTHGLSAELLLERIDKANAGWRWIRRVSGVSVPAPSVAHLRWQGQTGHYTAVLESSEDAARIEDIFLQYASWIDHEAFARQCSGFFLVPPNAAVPENFVPVGNAELAGVFGRNSCPNGKNPEDDDPCPKECGGMPVMTFSRTVPMLYIQDRPLPYRAQVGPTPDLLIQYRQRDFSGDSNILDDTSHFGPNWNHGLFSYIRAETGAAFPNAAPARWITAGSYLRYNRSGSTNTAPYVKPFPDRPALTALSSPAGFRLTFNDGTQMDFRQPNLPSNPTRYFLTTVRDAGNLAYTIHYINDGSNRIDYVVDASGTKTKFLYEGGDTKIKYIVTEYAEPVGPSVSQPTPVEVNAFLPEYRHASFTYNSGGLLASISDAAGLVSGFQYNDTKVVKMTTPYGDTKVSYQGTVEPSNSGWAITVTDPEGLVNRVESLYHDFYTPYFGGGAENPLREVHPPASISVRGTNVSFLTHHSSMAAHNDVTLEWTPKYWREYLKAKQQNPEIDPRLFAATTKWAMSYPSDQTVSVPLAYKEPGKAAVFYNYDGQTSGQHAGTSTQPSKTARQVEGRTATDGAKWVVSQQTYNSLGLPLVHTDELGRRTRVTYHTNNRDVHLEQYLGPNNTTWFTIRSYTGYSGGRPGTITEASGLQTVVTRNPQLQPTLINVKKGTSAAQNRRTRYTYNNGLVTQIHSVGSPDILLESMTYDNLGRLATHTDSRGYTRTFEFDNLDRILLVTHPDDSTESWTYERPEGFSLDATGYKDRSGRAHRTVYDRIRRPVAKIDPMGKITRYDWCSCGSLSKLIDPAGRTTTWVRDIQGRVTEKIMPDGVTKTSYTYQPLSGRLASKTYPNDQGGANPTVRYWYYEEGTLRMEDWLDDTIDVTYYYTTTKADTATNWDGLKRLSFVQDAIGEHAFSFIPLNSSANIAGEGSVSLIDGPLENDDILYAYDWRDRVNQVRVQSDSTPAVVSHEQTTTWDILNRVSTVVNTLGTFTHNYADASPRVWWISRPNNMATTFAYYAGTDDEGARVGELAQVENHTTTEVADKHWYSFDHAGRITRWRRQPGTLAADIRIRDLDYNLSDELIQSIDRLNPNQEVDRQTWGLDDIGNWLSTTQTNGNLMQTRSHDVMNRLQQIGGGGSVVVEGTVNEYADITVNSVPANLFEDPLLSPPGYRYRAPVPVVTGANTITVTATDQDQDVATTQWSINVPASQRTFTYDANGNMLTDSAGRVFTWDGKNRLKTVTVSGTTYEWDYDYRDRRVREFVYASGGSKPTIPAKQFVWHDNEIVQERVGTSATAGTIARNHYFGGFTIGATVSTAAKYQTFTDHLGHVREVVAASGTSPAIGTVVTRYDYTPYQGPTKVYQFPSTNVEVTFQTIGRYYHHEPSGLELALYRAYDAELGRWISEDPLEEEGGLNLYGFVGNGPTGAIDLLGLTGWGLPPQQYLNNREFADAYYEEVQRTAKIIACTYPAALGARAVGAGIGAVGSSSVLSSRYIPQAAVKATKGDVAVASIGYGKRIMAGIRYCRAAIGNPWNSPAARLNRARARQMFFGGNPPGGISNFR